MDNHIDYFGNKMRVSINTLIVTITNGLQYWRTEHQAITGIIFIAWLIGASAFLHPM